MSLLEIDFEQIGAVQDRDGQAAKSRPQGM